jgi:hypothetical protein
LTRWRVLLTEVRLAKPGVYGSKLVRTVGYSFESMFRRAFRLATVLVEESHVGIILSVIQYGD